jgi:hypothetical protein
LKQAQLVQAPGAASNTIIQPKNEQVKNKSAKDQSSFVLIGIPVTLIGNTRKKLRTSQRKSISVLIRISVTIP